MYHAMRHFHNLNYQTYMADNTEEEHTDHPGDSKAENIPGKDVPESDRETGTPDQPIKSAENPSDIFIPPPGNDQDSSNQETKNMEVHHHGHHHKEHESKRGWKSYFWEFLMLFLAVFCGSLAEYGLDHKIEDDRKEQYITTMISDLKEDTTKLGESITRFKQKGIEIDSLSVLLNSANKNDLGADLYYYGRLASRFDFFTSTDHTIKQLENSGTFRLIRNIDAASAISKYYSEMNGTNLLQNNTNELAMEYRPLAYTLFDPIGFEAMVNDETNNVISIPEGNPVLISHDKSAIARLGSTLHYIKGSRLVLYNRYVYLHKKATALIEQLQHQYQLD